MSERACKHCGLAFEPRHHNAAYCSDECRKARTAADRKSERRRAYMRAYQLRWSKAQKLAIAAAIAPAMRRPKRPRRITVVDAETGQPLRTVSDTQLGLALAKRAGIELQADRPSDAFVCERCGRLSRKTSKRQRKLVCALCRLPKCSDCSKPVSQNGAYTARKAGRPVRCRPCTDKARETRQPQLCECGGRVSWEGARKAAKAGRKARCAKCAGPPHLRRFRRALEEGRVVEVQAGDSLEEAS